MTATIPLERMPRGKFDWSRAITVEQRRNKLDNGKVQAIPGEQGLAEIRKRLWE